MLLRGAELEGRYVCSDGEADQSDAGRLPLAV